MGDLDWTLIRQNIAVTKVPFTTNTKTKKNDIEILVTVGVNVKINRNYETTIDYFDYSVDAHFDEETFVVDGGKTGEGF